MACQYCCCSWVLWPKQFKISHVLTVGFFWVEVHFWDFWLLVSWVRSRLDLVGFSSLKNVYQQFDINFDLNAYGGNVFCISACLFCWAVIPCCGFCALLLSVLSVTFPIGSCRLTEFEFGTRYFVRRITSIGVSVNFCGFYVWYCHH